MKAGTFLEARTHHRVFLGGVVVDDQPQGHFRWSLAVDGFGEGEPLQTGYASSAVMLRMRPSRCSSGAPASAPFSRL